MERNNGVTAIIYLAFVRNRTLQPYFRSANTDAIFHSLTISPSPKLQMGFKHPFQPGHRPLATSLSFLEDPFEKKQKRRGEKMKRKKKTLLEIPKRGNPKGWDLPLRVSDHRKGFDLGSAGGWNFPTGLSTFSQLPSSGPEWTGVLMWRQAAVCAVLNTTLQPTACLTRRFIRWVIPLEL